MLLVSNRRCAASTAAGQSVRIDSLLHSVIPVEDSLSSGVEVEAIQDSISDLPIAPVDESFETSRARVFCGNLTT